jgi:hypothetical protein
VRGCRWVREVVGSCISVAVRQCDGVTVNFSEHKWKQVNTNAHKCTLILILNSIAPKGRVMVAKNAMEVS